MKKLSTLFASAILALSLASIGCGDNVLEDSDLETLPSDRGSEIVIIPNQDEAMTALESAESLGFVVVEINDDEGYITAIGDLSLSDKARDMPGIFNVLPADAGQPIIPDYGVNSRVPDRADTPGDLHGDSGNSYQDGNSAALPPEATPAPGSSLHSAGPDGSGIYSPDEIIGGKR